MESDPLLFEDYHRFGHVYIILFKVQFRVKKV